MVFFLVGDWWVIEEKSTHKFLCKCLIFMASPTWIEHVAYSLGGCRSIRLSYEDVKFHAVLQWNFLDVTIYFGQHRKREAIQRINASSLNERAGTGIFLNKNAIIPIPNQNYNNFDLELEWAAKSRPRRVVPCLCFCCVFRASSFCSCGKKHVKISSWNRIGIR